MQDPMVGGLFTYFTLDFCNLRFFVEYIDTP